MKCQSNLTRVFLPTLTLLLLITLVEMSGLTSSPPIVHAATTASTSSFDVTGTWQGQGTYNDGRTGYDMILTITSMNGNTFSGTLAEDTYTSAVAISGSVTSVSNGNASITYTDPSTLWGGQIALNTTYTATVSSGQMNGSWYYAGDSSPDGTNTLNKTFAPTITTDCGHLVTPWIALYQSANFGGRELCFEGTGAIDLSQFGFDKQTMAINIAASGTFFTQADGQGNQQAFYYGEQLSDLGAWDNQISSFIIYGTTAPSATTKPGGMWVYPGNGFTFYQGNTYTIVAQGYQTRPADPAIDHVNITGYWNNTWHVICRVPNNQPALGNYYYCSTDFLLNGQYPPAGKIEMSFDVYDVAGNRNLAPNGIHTGTFSITKAPVTYYPSPPPAIDTTGQIDPIIQTYEDCVAEVFFEKYVKIAGLTNRFFQLAYNVYDYYGKEKTAYTVYQDIKTGQFIAIPVELLKTIPGSSCVQVIIETTTARPAS